MINTMSAYQKKIENILKDNPGKIDWQHEYNYFLIQLKNLQHERLIHLIVTMTVGLAVLITGLTLISTYTIFTLCLSIILLPLFTAYIIHYQKLENMTQKWYTLLDKMNNLIHNKL